MSTASGGTRYVPFKAKKKKKKTKQISTDEWFKSLGTDMDAHQRVLKLLGNSLPTMNYSNYNNNNLKHFHKPDIIKNASDNTSIIINQTSKTSKPATKRPNPYSDSLLDRKSRFPAVPGLKLKKNKAQTARSRASSRSSRTSQKEKKEKKPKSWSMASPDSVDSKLGDIIDNEPNLSDDYLTQFIYIDIAEQHWDFAHNPEINKEKVSNNLTQQDLNSINAYHLEDLEARRQLEEQTQIQQEKNKQYKKAAKPKAKQIKKSSSKETKLTTKSAPKLHGQISPRSRTKTKPPKTNINTAEVSRGKSASKSTKNIKEKSDDMRLGHGTLKKAEISSSSEVTSTSPWKSDQAATEFENNDDDFDDYDDDFDN